MKTFTTFTRSTNDPKLSHLEATLTLLGIPHQRNGESAHAPILEVLETDLERAEAILTEMFDIGNGKVMFDDLPDDHPIFRTEKNFSLEAYWSVKGQLHHGTICVTAFTLERALEIARIGKMQPADAHDWDLACDNNHYPSDYYSVEAIDES